MTDQTSERAFESAVEAMLLEGGWVRGDRSEWDVDLALFPARAVAFMAAAQPELWERLTGRLGDRLEGLVMEQLVRELGLKGVLGVLRRGFRFQGCTLRLAQFRPAHGLNPEAVRLFALNELAVTRQVRCHPGRGDTVDVLLSLNGVPVATCELKNPMTGQTWRDAVRQYKADRDPDAAVFRFAERALVHFAADCDEVHMTTRLAGEATRFLPFNRGSRPGGVGCGAGNPRHSSGYRSGYFWEETLRRGRFLDIIGSYLFVEARDEKVYDSGGARTVRHETLIFPRYHQLDAVDRLVETARGDGPGRNYLVQHSAGSGKTNSISWLAHRLASLHTPDDSKVYDCVLVISDRRVLDRQLQDALHQIDHAQGVVKAIDRDSKQLARALVDGTKIVVTTLQKFPFVLKGLLAIAENGGEDGGTDATAAGRARTRRWRSEIAGRCYAVIVDEAHSGQTGDSAREMKAILGSRPEDARSRGGAAGPGDWQDGLNAVVESRGSQPNLSFFAFTATPKAKTVELFGRRGPGGVPEPFHVYSMRQAIEEGFILDVLGNYTDYDTYFRLVRNAEGDREFPKRRTATVLAKFASLHPHNIEQKTEVIVEHFRNHVRHRIGGRAKAMVVTSSRLHAVRYKQAFDRYIAERGYRDVHPLVAFSGTVRDPDTGEEFTEPSMNTDRVTGRPISEAALPGRFDTPDHRILLVAEKYQTGFDQPMLQAMYIDKRLGGVQAVQTLSRLNRTAPGKDAPFVLDFVNHPEDIRTAFAPYYDRARLQGCTDPYQLDRLKHHLDEARVYHLGEVDAFAAVFYQPPGRESGRGHARLQRHIQPAVGRFSRLESEQQTEFRDRLSAFVGLYAFVSQIIPYADSDLEKLSAFGRALLPHLRHDQQTVHLDDSDVELEYYRLQLVSSGAIALEGDEDGDTGYGDGDALLAGPSAVGTGSPEEPEAPLSEIIARLNDRFGTDFTESDRLFLQQIHHDAVSRDDIRSTALANDFDKFSLGIRPQLKELMIRRMTDNDTLVTRCLNNPDYQEIVFNGLLKAIFNAIEPQQLLPLTTLAPVGESAGTAPTAAPGHA